MHSVAATTTTTQDIHKMNKTNYLVLLSLLYLMSPASILAQSTDIAVLQQRIAELEQQNREIMEKLAELSDELVEKRNADETVETVELPRGVLTEANESELSFYGFARLDAIFDDSRPSAPQTPTFIPSESATGNNDGTFTLHPRLTRMGMNYKGSELDFFGRARISGKIEMDFQNGGSESRARIRYRHAYAKLDWDRSSLLLGQTWDIISPLYPTVNPDTMQWYAGNLGDRRVQARFTYKLNDNITVAAGLALTGAINLQDLDGNGLRDGEDSGMPHFQGRAGYSSPLFDIGVWGHVANEETAGAFSGHTDFDSHSVGADFVIRPFDRFTLKGEVWTGQGLGDVRGGIGQSINVLTGREIDSTGGWIELGFKATDSYTITGGWTVDNPDNDDLFAGARKLNRTWYLTNQLQLHPSFKIGLDYIHWQTDYMGLPKGTDNRFNIYSIYTF